MRFILILILIVLSSVGDSTLVSDYEQLLSTMVITQEGKAMALYEKLKHTKMGVMAKRDQNSGVLDVLIPDGGIHDPMIFGGFLNDDQGTIFKFALAFGGRASENALIILGHWFNLGDRIVKASTTAGGRLMMINWYRVKPLMLTYIADGTSNEVTATALTGILPGSDKTELKRTIKRIKRSIMAIRIAMNSV